MPSRYSSRESGGGSSTGFGASGVSHPGNFTQRALHCIPLADHGRLHSISRIFCAATGITVPGP
jgi:hypothetical protein